MPESPPIRPVTPTALAVALLLVACGPKTDDPSPSENRDRKPLVVPVDFERQVALRTSVLTFELPGTNRIPTESRSARVTFTGRRGNFAELETFYSAELVREGDVGDLTVRLPVDGSLWSEVNPENGDEFVGRIDIEVYDEIGVVVRGGVERATLRFRRGMKPEIDSLDVGQVHVNEAVTLDGSGFLRPDEGETIAVIEEGTLEHGDGSTVDLSGEQLPVRWTGRRSRATLRLDPSVLGIRPSSFDAVLRFRNALSDGTEVPGGTTVDVQGNIQETYIATLAPPAGSRGQIITVEGRGFVPSNADDDIGMLLRYEGTLEPDDDDRETRRLTGSRAIDRAPTRVVAEDEIEQTIWYSVEDRNLRGLGATPGTFEGTITPILIDGNHEQQGLPWEGTFRVLPTKQVVYLKYLPAFSKALETYGLRNVEHAIRKRVVEVIERDYAGYHVDVREEKPEDFTDYATVELGGPDPSGTRSFGYDNTFHGVAKDTGNLFLADYLGGVNAQAARQFNNPYGGIFISSFTFFSPTLNEGNPHTSEKFDTILEPFMPKLGGTPVRGTEWPEGPRTDQIERAIRMVGSVIGNTVTHEIGHSMGMTFVDGDFVQPRNVFHNEIPGPFIMDAGAERPFAERAELGDRPPARFNPENKEYLDKVLPRP